MYCALHYCALLEVVLVRKFFSLDTFDLFPFTVGDMHAFLKGAYASPCVSGRAQLLVLNLMIVVGSYLI